VNFHDADRVGSNLTSGRYVGVGEVWEWGAEGMKRKA